MIGSYYYYYYYYYIFLKMERLLVRITHKTLSQKNGFITLQSDSKALKKEDGFAKIIRFGADLATK